MIARWVVRRLSTMLSPFLRPTCSSRSWSAYHYSSREDDENDSRPTPRTSEHRLSTPAQLQCLRLSLSARFANSTLESASTFRSSSRGLGSQSSRLKPACDCSLDWANFHYHSPGCCRGLPFLPHPLCEPVDADASANRISPRLAEVPFCFPFFALQLCSECAWCVCLCGHVTCL